MRQHLNQDLKDEMEPAIQRRGKQKGWKRARKMISFLFLKDPSGCWVESGLGWGMMETRRPERKLLQIILGTDAGGSDPGDSGEGGGFWIYFKVGVMGLAVR